MYTVTAINHFDNIVFEQNYLEFGYAYLAFNTATSCVDCASAIIIDALTGEILDEWYSNKNPN